MSLNAIDPQIDAKGRVLNIFTQEYLKRVDLTNAELKALYTTAKEIVGNPGYNKIIMVLTMTLRLNAGSEVLTESNDNLIFVYKDKTGVQASQIIETTNFIDQTVDTFSNGRQKINIIGTAADLVNQPLCLFIDGNANFGGNVSGDATLTVWVRYRLEDVEV